MSNIEPVGGLYEIKILDTSVTASGLVLAAGAGGNFLLAEILKVPSRRRSLNGHIPLLVGFVGAKVIIAKTNVVEIKLGTVDALLTSDESIIAIVS